MDTVTKKRARKSTAKSAKKHSAKRGGKKAPTRNANNSNRTKRNNPSTHKLKPDVKKRILEVARSRRILNQEEGTDSLGSTNWLTPTRNGFITVEKLARAILDTQREKKIVEVFSYNLYLRYTGNDGKRREDSNLGVGLSIKSWVAKKHKGSKEQIIKSIRETVRTRIFELLSKHFDILSPGKQPGQEMTKEQAKRELKKIKSGRDIRFKLELFRTTVKPAKRKRKRAKAKK